ncbi:MAG: hypothetical protein ACRDPT_15290, partial [Streptomycetales bacterium]
PYAAAPSGHGCGRAARAGEPAPGLERVLSTRREVAPTMDIPREAWPDAGSSGRAPRGRG